MASFTLNPFRQRPRLIARLPRVVRLYLLHCVIGFALSAIFTALVLGFNVAGVGHLVKTVDSGWMAAFVFFILNGIVFSGVQLGIVVMSTDQPDR